MYAPPAEQGKLGSLPKLAIQHHFHRTLQLIKSSRLPSRVVTSNVQISEVYADWRATSSTHLKTKSLMKANRQGRLCCVILSRSSKNSRQTGFHRGARKDKPPFPLCLIKTKLLPKSFISQLPKQKHQNVWTSQQKYTRQPRKGDSPRRINGKSIKT